jgi:D-ribose pyranose/furanose isomerase RbsD
MNQDSIQQILDELRKDLRYQIILMEEVKDQNRAVREAVDDMQKTMADLPHMRDDMSELKSDMKIVKAAVTDLSHIVHDHERRITQLAH